MDNRGKRPPSGVGEESISLMTASSAGKGAASSSGAKEGKTPVHVGTLKLGSLRSNSIGSSAGLKTTGANKGPTYASNANLMRTATGAATTTAPSSAAAAAGVAKTAAAAAGGEGIGRAFSSSSSSSSLNPKLR